MEKKNRRVFIEYLRVYIPSEEAWKELDPEIKRVIERILEKSTRFINEFEEYRDRIVREALRTITIFENHVKTLRKLFNEITKEIFR